MTPRCPWAIKFGTTLHTRCLETAGHGDRHVGRGLPEFPDQRIYWLPGERHEYRTPRDDDFAWEDRTWAVPV